MDLSILQEGLALLDGHAGSPLLSAVSILCRVLLPILAIWLVERCARSLLRGRIERETWGRLTLPDGDYGEFHHWENTSGRSKRSDCVLNTPTFSRSPPRGAPGSARAPRGAPLGLQQVLVVHTLAVHPQFLARGVGRRLMEFAIAHARAQGMRAVRLDVNEKNVPAIRLYESLGFTHIDTVDLGYGIERVEWYRLYQLVL